MSSITVVREGLFGSVAVDVAQGSPSGTFPNDFGAGQLVINGSPLSFTGSRRNVTFFATVSLVSNLHKCARWRVASARQISQFRCRDSGDFYV